MSNYIGCCKECVYAAIGTFYHECRKYPPKFVDGSVNMFPLVSQLSWCGEFKKKEQ